MYWLHVWFLDFKFLIWNIFVCLVFIIILFKVRLILTENAGRNFGSKFKGKSLLLHVYYIQTCAHSFFGVQEMNEFSRALCLSFIWELTNELGQQRIILFQKLKLILQLWSSIKNTCMWRTIHSRCSLVLSALYSLEYLIYTFNENLLYICFLFHLPRIDVIPLTRFAVVHLQTVLNNCLCGSGKSSLQLLVLEYVGVLLTEEQRTSENWGIRYACQYN